jgi:tetratricopeptide (TPR) repeat protein
MEEPTAATARKSARGPSLRRLMWSTIWFCLAAWLLIRLPHEVSYWMLALAEKASLEGRTDAALAWVERAKEWTPKSVLPRNVAALILQKAGKLDELGRIDFVLEKDDLTPEQRAALHLEKSDLLRRKRRFDDALAELDKAADYKGALRPSQQRLELLLLAKQEDQARREVKQLLDACSTDAERAQVHLRKCEFHQKQAQWEEALQEFDAAAVLDPKLRPSIARFALLMQTKRTDEATQELDKLLEISTSDADKTKFHLELSAIYRSQKRWDDALREFAAAMELKPELRSMPDHMELLLLTGKREEARQELPAVEGRLASSWQVRRVDIDNLMAYFMALIGEDLDQALQRVEQALKWDGNSEAYLDTRAFVLYRLGRYNEALPDAERAVESIERKFAEKSDDAEAKKNVAVIVYHRSLILEALGKSAEAERDRARVRELGFEPDERLF